ncbi:MAG: hypothetical protein RL141_226 [Candidatus Parcubacteria bacterium]|jgi:hypothetical protein
MNFSQFFLISLFISGLLIGMTTPASAQEVDVHQDFADSQFQENKSWVAEYEQAREPHPWEFRLGGAGVLRESWNAAEADGFGEVIYRFEDPLAFGVYMGAAGGTSFGIATVGVAYRQYYWGWRMGFGAGADRELGAVGSLRVSFYTKLTRELILDLSGFTLTSPATMNRDNALITSLSMGYLL